ILESFEIHSPNFYYSTVTSGVCYSLLKIILPGKILPINQSQGFFLPFRKFGLEIWKRRGVKSSFCSDLRLLLRPTLPGRNSKHKTYHVSLRRRTSPT